MHFLYCFLKSSVGLLSIKSVRGCLHLFICSECSLGCSPFFILTRMHQHLLLFSQWWDTVYMFKCSSFSGSVRAHLYTRSLYHVFYTWHGTKRGTASACHLGRIEGSGNPWNEILPQTYLREPDSYQRLWSAVRKDLFFRMEYKCLVESKVTKNMKSLNSIQCREMQV